MCYFLGHRRKQYLQLTAYSNTVVQRYDAPNTGFGYSDRSGIKSSVFPLERATNIANRACQHRDDSTYDKRDRYRPAG